MKKLILVSVFAALTIGTSAALTACGTSGEPAPSETTTSVSGVIDADASAVSRKVPPFPRKHLHRLFPK